MTKDEWKETIKDKKFVDIANNPHARIIREAMGELGKAGILFIPVSSHLYMRVDEATPLDLVEKALHSNVQHLKTQYRNKIKPFRQFISEEKMKEMMGQLSFMDQL